MRGAGPRPPSWLGCYLGVKHTRQISAGSDAQAGAFAGAGVGVELVIIARQDGVQQNAGQGSNGQAGQGNADTADAEGDAAHGVKAQSAHQDNGSNDQVTAVGKVDLIFHYVANTDGGDHAVQHKADTTDDAGRNGVDDGFKLGAEAQDAGKYSGNADDQGIIDLGQGQNAGVFAVGGVGGTAQQAGHGGCQAVAHQGAVQAGVTDIVAAGGGADGGNIADVLHHGCNGNGHDGEQGADEFFAAVNGKQTHGLFVDGETDPGGLADGGKVNRTSYQGNRIADQNTDQNGQDLDHAFAPDVADDNGGQRHKSQQPVALAVVDGGRGQDQANGDDDGAGDNRREEPHDAADAEHRDQPADQHIQQAAERNGCAGVGQVFRVGTVIADNGKAAQVGKAGTQKCGNLALADDVEQQRAKAGAQQRGGNAQAGQQGNQHGCAKHGEHVLRTQDQHPGRAQFFGIVNALGIINGIAHKMNPPYRACVCGRRAECRKQKPAGQKDTHTLSSLPESTVYKGLHRVGI